MIKYISEFPHKIYEEWSDKELFDIDLLLKKTFYPKLSTFNPTLNYDDASFLMETFHHVEIEKEGDNWFACIHTGDSNNEGNEVIFFVEAKQFPLALSLAAYEYVQAGYR